MRMRKRALLGAVSAATMVGLALPATGSAVTTQKIDVVGGNVYKIGQFAKSTLRFKNLVTAAKSGSTLTITNKTNEPHSLSVVKKSDLPNTTKEIDGCFEGGPCLDLFKAHEFPEDDGPPAKPEILGDDGGLSAPGDSVVFGPKGQGGTLKVKLTAKKGTTLSYFCGFHPWMQGSIKAN